MFDLFVGADLAGRGTRALAHSARPDAAVVAPAVVASPGPRARVAAALHRLASALEPAEGRDRRVSTRVEPGSAC